MKIPAKILVYCIWFGLVILLSIYCGDVFSALMDWMKRKIIRTEISPQIDFATTIIPWNVFTSLLLCVPLLFIKGRRAMAVSEFRDAVVFFSLLLAWNLVGIIHLWIFFPDSIGSYSGAPSLSTIEPYAIKEGWSPLKLWCAWWGFIVLSNAFSAAFVVLTRRSRQANGSKPILLS